MTTMNISLPEPMRAYVDRQVKRGGYSTTSEYLRELIREDQRRKAREELEAQLLEGLESETSEMTDEDWETIRRDARERIKSKKKHAA